MRHYVTPDGKYFVVRGRLWRMTNPHLGPEEKLELTRRLMRLRGKIRAAHLAGDELEVRACRSELDEIKRALGERGPVWWSDGAPDYNRKMARNTPYAEWFAKVSEKAKA